MSIKPVTVAECDPELEAALEALHFVVPSYRAARAKFLYASSDPDRYREMAAIKFEVAELRDNIRAQAERCNLKPDALIQIVEAAASLNPFVRGKRKSPAVNALLANLATAQGYATKVAQEAREELALADYGARLAARSLANLGEATEYLEASRG